MKKLILLAGSALLFATPAAAVDLGIATGSSGSASTSQAGSASVGQSSSALLGFSAQQSSGAANSNGTGFSVISGNDTLSGSNHTSQTAQQGSTVSLGLAQSSNANQTIAQGASAGAANLTGVWIFLQP